MRPERTSSGLDPEPPAGGHASRGPLPPSPAALGPEGRWLPLWTWGSAELGRFPRSDPCTSRLFLYLGTDTRSNVTVSLHPWEDRTSRRMEKVLVHLAQCPHEPRTAGQSSAPRRAAISPSVPTRRQGTTQARGPQGSSQPRLCPPTSTRLTPPSHARCSPASNVLLYDHGR